MIIRLAYTEDDISVEERNKILEELAREKGHLNYAALKYDCARRRGYSSWAEYQKVLIRKRRERGRKGNNKYLFVKESEKKKKAHKKKQKERLEKAIFSGMF
jgi:hypothetical protein